jgi:membrane protein
MARCVWIGAIVTAVLFEVGKFLIGLYIGKQGLESTFGAAASLVVLLIWVYYSAQIVLLGAEFTTPEHKKANAAVLADDPLRAFAKQSPAVVIGLAFAAGLVLSHPMVQCLYQP